MKKNIIYIIAVCAIFLPPLLLLIQSRHTSTATEPQLSQAEQEQNAYDAMTMAAFWGNEKALIQTVAYCAQHGDRIRAEHWLRYGALDLQRFSVLVAYGDFLAASSEKKTTARADYWYTKALNQVLAQPPFPARNDLIFLLQQKRKDAMQKQESEQ
ncbi:MAG TPA: hypothetical protein DDZ11_04490 [Lentisphaeria bacterium]|nr:hypothetical protein [Lentisphaeria bacterium]